ncbi:MAG: PLP-dependent transferase [Acidobacteriota bacterium]
MATPFLQRPLALGVDLVMHSTTSISGHCDAMGGVVAREENAGIQVASLAQVTGGAVPSPFDSWLVAQVYRAVANARALQ